MPDATFRLSNELVTALDAAAHELGLSREAVVRQAIEAYLDVVDDAGGAVAALQDPSDPIDD